MNSRIRFSDDQIVRSVESETANVCSYLKNGKLVHKSYSDTFENLLERNNNKDLPLFTRIKCFIGLGSYEECHPAESKKLSSAPSVLTHQETLDLVEQKCASLKSRIEILENLTDKLKDKPKDCKKKNKKKNKCNPYIEFYSRFCAKKPPKPCIQSTQYNAEETTQLRTVATRSRSPTPSRQRSPRQKPKRQNCKTSENSIPENKSSPSSSKMLCASSYPPFTSDYKPPSFNNKENKFYRARNNCDNIQSFGQYASPNQTNTCKGQRSRSISRKGPNDMFMKSPNNNLNQCPCKKEKSRSAVFQSKSPRSRNCSPPCNTSLKYGIESDCVFAGLGSSYNRSKSGDSAAKMLLAKYRHSIPGEYTSTESVSKHVSGDKCSMNRTNSRRQDSPELRNRRPMFDQESCISYASQPKKQKHHKKVELYSSCMKQVGPRSPVELFHALKRAEGWEKMKKSPKLTKSVSADQQVVPKPPYTREVLEKEILENTVFKNKKNKNKNTSALDSEIDIFDTIGICARNDSPYQYQCQEIYQDDNVHLMKSCHDFDNPDLENISFHLENQGESILSQTNVSICSNIKCKNNNFGDENFRFFRQFLNITPAAPEPQSTSGQGDSEQLIAPVEDQALINSMMMNVDNIYNNTETLPDNSQADIIEDDIIDNKVSRLDNWILGEFPENIAPKINKTTVKKRSSGGVAKKRSTAKVGNKKFPTKKSVVTRKSIETTKRPPTRRIETIQYSKYPKSINHEIITDSEPYSPTHSVLSSPRKSSDIGFTSPERYLPQKVSEDSLSEEISDFVDKIEKTPILKEEEIVVHKVEKKRSAKTSFVESPRKGNDKQGKVIYYSTRKLSPRSPRTRSEEKKYIPIEKINEQISAEKQLDKPPQKSESGESSVDDESFDSKLSEESSGVSFISRFTSFWKSKPKATTPDLERNDSDLILCGKESSVDLVEQGHCKESSVDVVNRDGSSNNGYCSHMEKTCSSSSMLDDTGKFPQIIESIEPGECVREMSFEISHSKADEDESALITSLCNKYNDDFVQENTSNNNGGSSEDGLDNEENAEANNAEVQNSTPTTPNNDSKPSPKIPSGVTNPLLQQLFASSGVTWTKVSAGDVDVANIRRAKEEFMKRQRAKKAAGIIPNPDTSGGSNSESLTLDLPVISKKKTIPIEVANALAEENETPNDADNPTGAICKK